jgi:hypothetical protein
VLIESILCTSLIIYQLFDFYEKHLKWRSVHDVDDEDESEGEDKDKD